MTLKRPRFYFREPDGTIRANTFDGESAARFEDRESDWRIASTFVGPIEISTVFLCTDLEGEGPPVLFETMVFGGPIDGAHEHYHTEADARYGHAQVVQWLLALHPGGALAFYPAEDSRRL